MCLNVPVKVIRLLGNKQILVQNRFGKDRVVSTELLGCATLDDYVIVRGAHALQKLTEEEAKAAISAALDLAVMIQSDLSPLVLVC